jgi:hypothetical protein
MSARRAALRRAAPRRANGAQPRLKIEVMPFSF